MRRDGSSNFVEQVKTAGTYRHGTMQKLALNSIVDLVHYAIWSHIAEL